MHTLPVRNSPTTYASSILVRNFPTIYAPSTSKEFSNHHASSVPVRNSPTTYVHSTSKEFSNHLYMHSLPLRNSLLAPLALLQSGFTYTASKVHSSRSRTNNEEGLPPLSVSVSVSLSLHIITSSYIYNTPVVQLWGPSTPPRIYRCNQYWPSHCRWRLSNGSSLHYRESFSSSTGLCTWMSTCSSPLGVLSTRLMILLYAAVPILYKMCQNSNYKLNFTSHLTLFGPLARCFKFALAVIAIALKVLLFSSIIL